MQEQEKAVRHKEQLQESQKLIQESIDKKYFEIKKCFDENDLNDKTIIQNFQQIAQELEEYFRLSYDEPDFHISCICEYIIRACRARGFSDRQCRYVYDALESPNHIKYKRKLDLSSSQSVQPGRKRKEDSYLRFTLIKKHLAEIKKLGFEIGSLERDEHQDVMELILDLADEYTKELEKHNVPTINLKQQDMYESAKDDSKTKVTYPETKPARTRLSEAIKRQGETLLKVAKIVENEGEFHLGTGTKMLSDEQINKIADAWDTVTELFTPVLDRKWRMDHLHWFNIIKVADEWFKHTGATASKVQDYYGRWRSITREHVGARKENMPPFFNKVVEMMPHYFLFFTLWMSHVRIMQGAEFSTDLGPKLSEQSMR